MAPPVWVLSVDLQTKTATFTSGLADAARSARGSFNEIKTSAAEAGRATGTSMMEARHGVMLLGEEFGVHLPRALTSFIASIGPIGAVMEAAFPFLAIIVGATLLIEHLVKVREEAEKLEASETQFGTSIQNAFNSLNVKLLQAEIQSDELNKNHLAALKHQLELIDQQSMDDLIRSFGLVQKAADEYFKHIESHFWMAGRGAEDAKKNLEQFHVQYESLSAKGDKKGAHDLLAGTLDSAEKVLAAQKQLRAHFADMSAPGRKDDPRGEALKVLEAHRASTAATEDEIKAQSKLVEALRDTLQLEQSVAAVKATQTQNAEQKTGNEVRDDAYKALKEQMDAGKAGQEQEDRDREEARQRAIARIQQSEREKIEATRRGSAERLGAIDAAIREEETKGLQETSFYAALKTQRVETVREMAAEEARIREEAGREAASHASKMGELQIAAERHTLEVLNSGRRISAKEQAAQEKQLENESYALKLDALNKQIAALDKSDKDYDNKLRAIYNKQEEMEREHQQKITEIKDRAEIERNNRILAAEQRMKGEIARDLTSVLMQHQSFAAMMAHVGDQVATGLMESAIKYALTLDANKRHEAAAAARQGWLMGQKFPFPVNIAMAPVLAASAFESVMAFAEGGIVPGVGRGDVVPAMLTPGEHVADRKLTEGLRNMVRDGGGGPRHVVHLNYRPTYHVNTIDGDGIRDTLQQHADDFHAHFERTIRKMNQ